MEQENADAVAEDQADADTAKSELITTLTGYTDEAANRLEQYEGTLG
jgi:hypothetical protein